MRTLSNLDFLKLWERGSGLHPLDRALLVLTAALPEEPRDALADWPLGRRNASLAKLRVASFGRSLEGWVACPDCSQRLEFALDAEVLTNENEAMPSAVIAIGGYTFRLPTSRDLAKIAHQPDTHCAALLLLRQCCLDDKDLSGLDLDSIGDKLAEADPIAETLLHLHCADCDHQWDEPLDIGEWLWTEIDAQSRRLLLDVHDLATAYGWNENEILSLSEPRRALYLEMVRA